MKKPLIGLMPSHDTATDDLCMRPTYLRALKAAGAIPVILPLEATAEDLLQLADTLDGFLFTGGPDVHPFYFGEETHPSCGNISLSRDHMELTLLPLVLAAKKPILGICRGLQLINIGLGGTIYQDIPSQYEAPALVSHSQPAPYTMPIHHVNVLHDTLLTRITGSKTLAVNSMHHQAAKDIAPGLIASACAPDGIIEALEKPDYPWLLAVQWHPEYLQEKEDTAAAIFRSFAEACRKEK